MQAPALDRTIQQVEGKEAGATAAGQAAAAEAEEVVLEVEMASMQVASGRVLHEDAFEWINVDMDVSSPTYMPQGSSLCGQILQTNRPQGSLQYGLLVNQACTCC